MDHKTVVTLLREGLKQGQNSWLTVTSGSMRPLLYVNDQIEVTAVNVQHLTIGDIIVLDDGRSLVTHRLREIKTVDGQTYLRTRGDRLIHYDPPFLEQALVGRMIKRKRDNQQLDLEQNGRSYHLRLAQLASAEEWWLGRLGSLTTPPPTYLQRIVHFKFKVLSLLAIPH